MPLPSIWWQILLDLARWVAGVWLISWVFPSGQIRSMGKVIKAFDMDVEKSTYKFTYN